MPLVPKLEYLAEFKTILKDYKPSQDSIKILRKTKTAFIAGTTASGRNTIIGELLKTGEYFYILSNTTRPQRMHNGRLERNGEFYWHISEEEFLDGLKQGKYLEAAVIHNQQVSGSIISEYEKALKQDKIAITDMEGLYGPKYIRAYSPEARFVFMLPPAFEDWITRLNKRGIMAQEELRNRMQSAEKEINLALQQDFYCLVISGDLAANTQMVYDFTHGKDPDPETQKFARDHAEQLLIEIRLFLEN
jgi:guanylate kinase